MGDGVAQPRSAHGGHEQPELEPVSSDSLPELLLLFLGFPTVAISSEPRRQDPGNFDHL